MNKKIFLLGFTLPDSMVNEIMKHEKSMPIQTLKFANNLKSSLELISSQLVLISTHPVTNYPKNSKIFFRFEKFKIGSSTGLIIPFLNILGFKHLTRFVSGYICLKKSLSFKDDEILIIHGIHSPFLLIGYILNKLYKVKVICIVTDAPSDISVYNTIEKALRVIDKKLIFFFLNKVNGIITLSDLFIKDNALSVPYIVLDGFAHSSSFNISDIKNKNNKRFRFSYAGGLSEEYGVKLLVEAALLVPEVDLYIYGKGPLERYLKEVSASSTNIFYVGFVAPIDLQNELLKSDCLVNPRPSSQNFVRYSFPSKILEYMTLGIPVLTTKLPSISSEYYNYIYTIEDETVLGIANDIRRISAKSGSSLFLKGQKGRDFILKTRSIIAQSSKIKKFIDLI